MNHFKFHLLLSFSILHNFSYLPAVPLSVSSVLASRMGKRKAPGMQKRPVCRTILRCIEIVTCQWMPDGFHVYPDLMGPSCLQLKTQHSIASIARYFADSHRARNELLPVLHVPDQYIVQSQNPILAQGKVHRPRFPNFTGCHRQIGSFNLPLLHGTVKNCRAEHIFGNN